MITSEPKVLLLILLALPLLATAQFERPRIEIPSVHALNIEDAVLEVAVEGLAEPWAFEFLSPHEVLVTETRGRMLRISLRDGSQRALEGLPPIATDKQQAGLLDVALHPAFDKNTRIYFSYTEADASGAYYATVLDTAVLDGDRLVQRRRLLTAEPYAWSPSNFGGIIAFDDAGKLYFSVGDRSEPVTAQMGGLLQGKLLRLNDDGSVPADNPFVDDPEIDDRIWALGVRNPQGLHFDTPSGRLFEAEHGPMGGDEVNRIRRGANYGWPVISYGRNYSAEHLGFTPDQSSAQLEFHLATDPPWVIGDEIAREGLEQPLYYYTPSTAISPLTVVRGPMFPEWDGQILVGALKGRHVSKIDFDGSSVRSEERFLGELQARIRDLKVDREGAIWILTQDGRLLRLFRDPALRRPERAVTDPGRAVYDTVCRACHDSGAGGAPRLDQAADWAAVREREIEEVHRRVLEGYQGMPARGTCYRCSDALLRAATEYMLRQVEPREVKPSPAAVDDR
ncbi:MAG: hypothetical protein CVV18_01595 [Gammaproteobacteria bacterium HGW-Gammaproteobacteria-8]|nr:MAG: hypothetical protein CVV18_01595 [Gammaproteobacteria bacterium HGW-Gammaproteobacteria-8]